MLRQIEQINTGTGQRVLWPNHAGLGTAKGRDLFAQWYGGGLMAVFHQLPDQAEPVITVGVFSGFESVINPHGQAWVSLRQTLRCRMDVTASEGNKLWFDGLFGGDGARLRLTDGSRDGLVCLQIQVEGTITSDFALFTDRAGAHTWEHRRTVLVYPPEAEVSLRFLPRIIELAA